MYHMGYTLNALAYLQAGIYIEIPTVLVIFHSAILPFLDVFRDYMCRYFGVPESKACNNIKKPNIFQYLKKYEEKDNAKIPPKYQCCF